MNIEDIKEARKKYKVLIEQNEENKRINMELENLRNNPIVQRFQELEQVNVNNDLTLVRRAFSGNIRYDDSPYIDIYVFVEACNYAVGGTNNSKRIENADYLLYASIENEQRQFRIPPELKEIFEATHTVIQPNRKNYGWGSYNMIQKIYFDELLHSDIKNKEKNKRKCNKIC